MSPPRAFVLAAGRGSRLEPLTRTIAKPALPFVGSRILDRLLDALPAAGVEEAIVNLHQAPDSIRSLVSARGGSAPRVRFSDESALLLDTAGALLAWRAELADGDFFLVNGDCIHAVDLAALLREHRAGGAAATLAVRPRGEPGFGSLRVDAEGRVLAFGVPNRGAPDERHFLSVMVVAPRLLAFLPDGEPRPLGTFRDWFPRALAEGELFRVMETDAEWHAVDTRERYLAATRAYLELRGAGPFVDESARLDPSARIDRASAVHEGCRVSEGVVLEGSVLLPGVIVEAGVRLSGCLVGPGTRLARGERHREAILVAPAAAGP